MLHLNYCSLTRLAGVQSRNYWTPMLESGPDSRAARSLPDPSGTAAWERQLHTGLARS
jgi:hypothetical protein